MNPLETSFASCQAWQDSMTQEWISSPPSEDCTFTICELDDDKQLSTVQHHRWLQFLQVWKSVGWGCSNVILLTEELRPLQYGHPQPQAQIAKVGANQMLKCISSYGNSQGHRRFKLKESLVRFLNVVQQNFSSPRTVLLCDPDVNARLCKVQVMDNLYLLRTLHLCSVQSGLVLPWQ